MKATDHFHKPFQFLVRVWAAMLLLTAATAAHGQSLLVNGNFENYPFDTHFITGWTIDGPGRIEAKMEGSTSPSYSAAFSEGTDSQGNTLSQSFATIPGATYTLAFDAGIFGVKTGGALQLRLQVTGTSSLLDQTITPPYTGSWVASQIAFQRYQYVFVADSSATTLQFTDVGLGNAAADVVLDTVSVVGPGAPAPLVVNGSFEIPPFDQHGFVPGWYTGGTAVTETSEGSTDGTHALALNAGNDSENNFIVQEFPTVAGQLYYLEFDAGVFGVSTGAMWLYIEVGSGSTFFNKVVVPPAAGTSNAAQTVFQHYSFPFLAGGRTTKLAFQDIGLGNANADLLVDAVSVTPAPPLLANGNFEIAPFDVRNITGWAIGGNGRVESKNEGSTSPSHSATFSPGGDSQGNTLSQSFTTSPGQMYRLDFDAGIFGMETGTLQLRVQANGNAPLLNELVTPPYSATYIPASVKFQHYQFSFKADNTTTVLQFSDVGLGNANADVVLDTVSTTPLPTPTPGSLLINGDFENAWINNDRIIDGWTVGGNGNVVVTREGATPPADCVLHDPPCNHAAAFGFGSDSQGNTLSQQFVTVPGQVYTLDFDSGIFGIKTATMQLEVKVTGNSTLIDDTVTPPYAGTTSPSAVIFQHYHYSFTADSNTAVLQFSDIGLGNANADTIVDTVSINGSTPATASLLVGGNFDTPPFDTRGVIPGWNVNGAGFIEVKSEGATSGTHSAAFSEGSDSAGNQISQGFATVPGQVYTLEFDAGIFGMKTGDLQLEIDIPDVMFQTITPPYSATYNPGSVKFQHYRFTFIAPRNSAILFFTNVGLGNANADIVLDTVSVVGPAAPQ